MSTTGTSSKRQSTPTILSTTSTLTTIVTALTRCTKSIQGPWTGRKAHSATAIFIPRPLLSRKTSSVNSSTRLTTSRSHKLLG